MDENNQKQASIDFKSKLKNCTSSWEITIHMQQYMEAWCCPVKKKKVSNPINFGFAEVLSTTTIEAAI